MQSDDPRAGDARLERIRIYPVKSLDGVTVDATTITPAGALRHDREFALFDEQGQVVNAKRTDRIHLIRARFEPTAPLRVELSAPDQPALRLNLHDDADRVRAALWFGAFFGFTIEVRRAPETGFPDDSVRPGPTVISRETLDVVCTWLPPLTADELADRFRANLEVSGVPAFWEDQLISQTGVEFFLGDVRLFGLNACARCVVPTRDPITGALHPAFAKTLTDRRKTNLPPWADPANFSHYYRLSTNTRIDPDQSGKILRTGDAVRRDR